ncbi:MAG: 3-isopropylmalate dehydratase small subunit [Oscillospiraceae bacterium]|jgi:3-isopropylmalate/(R)-2-methylmalate dehydratase small subunit|nr:3-isopropylmalate dehydratase small subunit [Oscillospiraceae bacterium]
MSIFVYGDNVDTDVIIPARYLVHSDPEFLAAHCMEDIDVDFAERVAPGDIVVAGQNFGCGSSREHAPLALRACRVSCVLAKSFARIFYRNAINIGLPILECPEAVDGIAPGDEVTVDITTGRIENRTTGRVFAARPLPPFVQGIIDAGGLLSWIVRSEEAGLTGGNAI